MQDRVYIENERLRLVSDSTDAASSESETARHNKIEALRTLTRALLKEIDALAEGSPLESSAQVNLSDEVHRFEADLIRCALIRTGGRQRRAARLLNTKVATLNAKIKRYNLNEDELVNAATNLQQQIKQNGHSQP
ncbi:MAG TPA: helix-turn-helix domain-containing protein [Pyrinomonadaceae bacterium]|nr:helix-turn-helix domain-containing protein [Pyrinomonadaceae bacterium]